jgi:hypothetical protein
MDISKIQTRATQKEKKFDIRGQELYSGDIVVASMGSGSISTYIITGFTPRAIRLANIKHTNSDFLYFGDVLRITNLLDEYEIKNYELAKNSVLDNKRVAKETRIIKKTIMYLFYDKDTKEYGLYPATISSRPGKNIGKKDMQMHFTQLRELYPSCDFYAMQADYTLGLKNATPTYCIKLNVDIFDYYKVDNYKFYLIKKPENLNLDRWVFSDLKKLVDSTGLIFRTKLVAPYNNTISFLPKNQEMDWLRFYLHAINFIKNNGEPYVC